MSNDFGLISPIVAPVLGRVNRDERLKRDQPHHSDAQEKPAKKDAESDSPEEAQATDDSVSSQHIDLRI